MYMDRYYNIFNKIFIYRIEYIRCIAKILLIEKVIFLIVAYPFIFMIAFYFLTAAIYTTSMPEIALEFGESNRALQYSMTVFQLSTFVACIIAGFYADAFGKKNSIILSLFIVAFGSGICFFADSLNILIIGRFLQGLGSAAAFLLSIAAINDIFDRKRALMVFGIMALIANSLFSSSSAIGGLLTYYLGWRSIFIFIFLYALILAYASKRIVPSSLNAYEKTSWRENLLDYKRLFTHRTYICYALLQPIYTCATWFMMSHVTFYFQQKLGETSQVFGFILAAILVLFGVGGILSVRLSGMFGADRTVHIGLLVAFISIVTSIFVSYWADTSVFLIVLGLSLYQLGFGIITPASTSVAFNVYPKIATKASVVRAFSMTALSLLGSRLAEYADETNLLHLALFMGICWFFAFVLFYFRIPEVEKI